MGGAILQLIANSGASQNLWIDHNPQITFFKKLYRRHTPFAKELIPIQFKSKVDFGGSAVATIPPHGDLIHRIFVSFDIPKLSAMFLNTKSQDIKNVISNFQSTDYKFLQRLINCVSDKNAVEFDQIFGMIDEMINIYDSEINTRLDILEILKEYSNPIKISEMDSRQKPMIPVYQLESESFIPISPNKIFYNEKIMDQDFCEFKINLAEKWLSKKSDYYLIFELIKLINSAEKITINHVPVTNTKLLPEIIVNSHIFNDLLPNPEIQLEFYVNITGIDKLDSVYDDIQINSCIYNKHHELYSALENNKINYKTMNDYTKLDGYSLLKPNKDVAINNFYHFGPNFVQMLNTYNTIIGIFNGLAETIPIVVAKAFMFADAIPHDIYQEENSTPIGSTYYPTIIDPNFKEKFILSAANIEKPMDNNSFSPFNYVDTNECFYPNICSNSYMDLFNTHSNIMHNKIQNSIDKLIERYREKLFTSTEKMYFNNSLSMGNIYSYVIPTLKYLDKEHLRITNVFNMNVWYFYFFKYLDTLDENTFSIYIKNTINPKMTDNGLYFMKNMITLLKINIEYYMHEISYLLNDLYASSPSVYPSDTMKNYVPISYGTLVNGVNINTDLIAVTLIFHRNHIPSILEIFHFIYHFISEITVRKINEYLCIDIGHVDLLELSRIKNITKLLYYQIFGYFMNIYDSNKFEAPSNFSTNEYDSKDNTIINNYVSHFLGNTISDFLTNQNTLSNVIGQMEFYFSAEMLHMRELQKFYHNILFNENLILDRVGSTTAGLVSHFVNLFSLKSDNITNTDSLELDHIRIHWEKMFNLNNNDLYYSTIDIDRYNGLPYLNTSYHSRNYGEICASDNNSLRHPIPLPETNPYGINPNYYNHSDVISNNTSFPTSNDEILESELPVNWTNVNISNTQNNSNNVDEHHFQIFPIDYFRIKHELFHKSLIIPNNIQFIDGYQFNLLKLVKLTERLHKTYACYDKYLLCWLSDTIFYVIKNTNTNIIYNGNDKQITFSEILNTYLNYIEKSIDTENYEFPMNFLQYLLNVCENMVYLFDNGDNIGIYNMSPPYCAKKLKKSNAYVHHIINNNKADNIIDKFRALRDNFLSQYFYYVKNYDQINKIYLLREKSDEFIFLNISDLLCNIINDVFLEKESNDRLKQVPLTVYFYPDSFHEPIFELISIRNNLSDMAKFIFDYLIKLLSPNSTPRASFKDILDVINITYISTYEIYRRALKYNLCDTIMEILSVYQPILSNKLILSNKILNYIFSIASNRNLIEDNMIKISEMVQLYGIEYDEYYNYLDSKIKPIFNNPLQNQINIINTINEDLDYFFIKTIDLNAEMGITFKKYIMDILFSNELLQPYTELKIYFNYIDSEYYSFIYLLFNYLTQNKLIPKNPLLNYTSINLAHDSECIKNYYHSFLTISDALQYFMDYIWDCAMEPSNTDSLLIGNQLGYNDRFSNIINKYYSSNQTDGFSSNNISEQEAPIRNIAHIINSLNSSLNKNEFSSLMNKNTNQSENSDHNLYYQWLNIRSNIILLLKEIAGKSILILDTQLKEINNIKNKIHTIMYRNKKAKTAWIRKLSHFLVSDITIKCGDDDRNHHISDWIESYHELSKDAGSEKGYLKMIGNRDDLIIFDDKIKNSYTIVLPLVFYFNKNIFSSIPINASMNTKYEISIKLRTLDEVSYKEEFSNFVEHERFSSENTDKNPVLPYTPKLSNVYLMAEYIYLGTEERRIFSGKLLEYLMDEVQYDNCTTLNDSNLIPVYKIGTEKKKSTSIKSGIKKTTEYYKNSKALLIDKKDLESRKYDVDLIPYNDYYIQNYIAMGNIQRQMMKNVRLYKVDPYIHQKRIEIENHFRNPTKTMIILIKPIMHTDPSIRFDDNHYFYGERQWDNYGLYSYYDLSKITEAKIKFYAKIKKKINDLENKEFGFISIINKILYQYTINNNISDVFLESLHGIKDAYLSYNDTIFDGINTVYLKNCFLSLKINFEIWDNKILHKMINDIYRKLGIVMSSESEINKFMSNNYLGWEYIDYDTFGCIIKKLLKSNNLDTQKTIDHVYNKYNESVVILLIKTIFKIINIENTNNHEPQNIIFYFNQLYHTFPGYDPNILNVSNLIGKYITNIVGKNNFKNMTYHDIINQILYSNAKTIDEIYEKIIPDDMVKLISLKMMHKLNEFINNYHVKIIDYQKNITPNPKINPLVGGYLKFNEYNIMPINTNSTMWSEAESYQYFNHTPSVGINLHSWSLHPLDNQISGQINLSKIDKFESIYDVHPKIGDVYPATVVTMVDTINIMRYLSGMCGKTW